MTKRAMIYAKFETLEEQLAHCYFLLHERFIANPPLARFWAEAAMADVGDHEQTRPAVAGVSRFGNAGSLAYLNSRLILRIAAL